MFLEEWEAYWEDICTKSKLVKHGFNGQRCWFPRSVDESPAAGKNTGPKYIVHDAFYGSGKSQTQWLMTSEFFFLVNCTTKGNLADNAKAARRQALTIVEEFDARLREDYENGELCELIEDLLEPVIAEADMTDQSAFGYSFVVKVAIARAEYDPEKWEE